MDKSLSKLGFDLEDSPSPQSSPIKGEEAKIFFASAICSLSHVHGSMTEGNPAGDTPTPRTVNCLLQIKHAVRPDAELDEALKGNSIRGESFT